MQNSSDKEKALPCYLSSYKYRSSFKISRRKTTASKNSEEYKRILRETQNDKISFHTESLDKIIKNATRILK